MAHWRDTENCEYPICDADEAVPVWLVRYGEVVEAWYRNPSMNVFWFESDTGAEMSGNLWMEALSLTGKPELPK